MGGPGKEPPDLLQFFMKKNLYLLILLLSGFAVLQSCKKEDSEYPEIQTLEATGLSATKAVFKANIINKGKATVLDYGFIYGESSNLSDTYGTKVSLGKEVPSGVISKEVQGIYLNSAYYGNRTLYVRAYIQNSEGFAFGKTNSCSMPFSTSSSVTPSRGKVGDAITINGNYPSVTSSDVTASVGGQSATVTQVTATKIVIQVPAGIQAAHGNTVPISLNVGGQIINLNYQFSIVANIKDFFPKSGPVGTVVTFSGDNLPNYYYSGSTVRIYFGTTEGSTSNNYPSSFRATVPISVTQERLSLSYSVDGITTVIPGEFVVTPPTVTSISPESALPGSQITISGTNFPSSYYYYYESNPQLTIGGVAVSPAVSNSSQLVVTIPTSLSAGDHSIILKSGPHTVEAPQKIRVISPSISSFLPTSGAVGREVNISGTFLPGQSYQVYFGNISTYGSSTSSTNLRANVPSGLDAGKVKISVKIGSQTIYAADEFTVIGPSISGFSPTSGVPGTVITINGTGFNSYLYNNTVKFGTTTTSILSVTENSIRAVVPSNVTPGAMKITVVTNGQTVVSDSNFTVTN